MSLAEHGVPAIYRVKATGGGYLSPRTGTGQLPPGERQTSEGFQSSDTFSHKGTPEAVNPVTPLSPKNFRDVAPDSAYEEGIKRGDHAAARYKERVGPLDERFEQLRHALTDKGLPPGEYYLPIRSDHSVQGFATYRTVPGKAHPVLTTVLGPGMRPRGVDVEQRSKKAVYFTTDQLDPREPESLAWNLRHNIVGSGPSHWQAISKMFDDLAIMRDTPTLNSGNEDTITQDI